MTEYKEGDIVLAMADMAEYSIVRKDSLIRVIDQSNEIHTGHYLGACGVPGYDHNRS